MASPSILKIQMFGEFSLTYGDRVIADRHIHAGKLWTVLAYLVTFRAREIPQQEIIDLLWPEDHHTAAPANTLKTLLHRVRAQVGQLDPTTLSQAISYQRGTYRWSPDIPCEIDVDLFQEYAKKAEKTTDTQKRMQLLLQAIALYQGDFLPRNATDGWVVPILTFYRRQYTQLVEDALDLLEAQGDYLKGLEVCQKAISLNPYEETLHIHLMQCLLATGDSRGAMEHYRHVTDLFFTQFGISPSEELTGIYRELVKTSHSQNADILLMKEELEAGNWDTGAFFCEYAFFKDTCHIAMRNMAWSGQPMQLALLMVTNRATDDITPKQRNKAMASLQEILATTLQPNHVFTRYSLTQYLALLPSFTFPEGSDILHRVLVAFRSRHPKLPVVLQYKVLPLAQSPHSLEL